MGKYDGATVEVENWTDYNPRTETKRPSWFRFENDLATTEKMFGLDCEQRWLWVVILSLLSRRNGEAITWNSAYIEAVTGIKAKKQESTLEIFEKTMSLRVTRTEACESSADMCGARALRDETNETRRTNDNAHSRVSFDLESLYRKYPRKLGKQQGLAKARREVGSQDDFDALSRAIDRYGRHCREKGIEEKFIKHFSTFMTSWRDWLDPDVGKFTAPSAAPKPYQPPPETDALEHDPDGAAKVREIMQKAMRGIA